MYDQPWARIFLSSAIPNFFYDLSMNFTRFVSRLSNKNTVYCEENEKCIRVETGKEQRSFDRAELN